MVTLISGFFPMYARYVKKPENSVTTCHRTTCVTSLAPWTRGGAVVTSGDGFFGQVFSDIVFEKLPERRVAMRHRRLNEQRRGRRRAMMPASSDFSPHVHFK